MINLIIHENSKFELLFDDTNRFAPCRLIYIIDNSAINIYEDYLYVFVENMLGRINEIPILNQENLFGKLGRWQEYYFYNKKYVQKHSEEIGMMERAIFLSAEKYGIFLYKYKDKFWIEINKGFGKSCKQSPCKYYSNPINYRVYLSEISYERIQEWKKELERYREMLC